MKVLTVNIVLVLLMCVSYTASAEITIVRSSPAGPYKDAATALVEELANSGYTNKTSHIMDLNTMMLSKTEVMSAAEGGVFVAIGTKAAIYLAKHLPSPNRLTYCMVANVDALQEAAMIRGAGIGTDIPLDAQFRLISKTVPSMKVLGMLYRSDQARSNQGMTLAQSALPNGLRLKAIDTSQYNSMSEAIKTLCEENIDLIWTHSDASIYNPAVIRSLLLTSLRKGIPVFGYSVPFVKAGALLGVGISPSSQGRELAPHVLQLLGDQFTLNPSVVDLEIREINPEFEIAVNLIVAENLSITIPNAVIEKATHVYRSYPHKN